MVHGAAQRLLTPLGVVGVRDHGDGVTLPLLNHVAHHLEIVIIIIIIFIIIINITTTLNWSATVSYSRMVSL